MKQQLIDRNECITQINTLIEALKQQYALNVSNGEKGGEIFTEIVNSQYIRSEIVAKMPIVEERDI